MDAGEVIGQEVKRDCVRVVLGLLVFRPFNRGCLSTPIRHPCRGQGPFRGLSLMIVFGGGCLNVWIEV